MCNERNYMGIFQLGPFEVRHAYSGLCGSTELITKLVNSVNSHAKRWNDMKAMIMPLEDGKAQIIYLIV